MPGNFFSQNRIALPKGWHVLAIYLYVLLKKCEETEQQSCKGETSIKIYFAASLALGMMFKLGAKLYGCSPNPNETKPSELNNSSS